MRRHLPCLGLRGRPGERIAVRLALSLDNFFHPNFFIPLPYFHGFSYRVGLTFWTSEWVPLLSLLITEVALFSLNAGQGASCFSLFLPHLAPSLAQRRLSTGVHLPMLLIELCN